MKILFVLGNGFDIDLGWQTQFSEFAKSKHWPKRMEPYSRLQDMLNQSRAISNWFDLERLLADYADSRNGATMPSYAQRDIKYFDLLSTSLISYLLEQQEAPVRLDSTAAKVLRVLMQVAPVVKIYSFNYTDLKLIAEKLGVSTSFQYEHVHGNLQDASAILGIQDSIDVCDDYEFLYKTFNRNYSSHDIQFDLLDADEVIFFGHSFGKTDYHYFQRFFQMQCRTDMQRVDSKGITIFTYDYNARISLLKQLRIMNEKRTDLLYGLNNLNIFMTDGSEDNNIEDFLKEFGQRLKKAYIKENTKYTVRIK